MPTADPKPAEIATSVAARLLGFSIRHTQELFQRGVFKTAHKPGFGEKSHWRVQRSEVISRKYHPTVNRNLYA